MLYYFYGIDGRLVEHPINDRVMAIPVESLVAAPHRILISGGASKIDAIIGAIRMLKLTALMTDEVTAASVLDRVGISVPR
jgi:DNA-binding transcriptional regulator LsrR (DeoR family)